MEIIRRFFGGKSSPILTESTSQKEQAYWENLSPAERATITAYTKSLRDQWKRSGEVDFLLLGVGSYARQISGESVAPRDIDLRVATSAPVDSELQARMVSGVEKLTRDFLDAEGLDYTQTSGADWHLVEAIAGGKTETIPFMDYGYNNIRFIVGAGIGRRPLDIIIHGYGGPDLAWQLSEELKPGKKSVILLDTRQAPIA